MVNFRSFDDVDTEKKWIDEAIKKAFEGKRYIGKNVTLKLSNVFIEPKEYSLKDQKDALIQNRNLSRAVKASVELSDNKTGAVIDSKSKVIAQAPYHTGRNSVISNGSYYVLSNQLKLRPGVYVREKETGDIEAHFNLRSGTGSGFRVNVNPDTGVFNMDLHNSNIRLYPLLKNMGISDDRLKREWGDEIWAQNAVDSGDPNKEILKLYTKLLPFGNPNAPDDVKIKNIIDALKKSGMDKEVNEITLGFPHENITGDAMIDVTKKILKVRRGEEEPVSRDSLQFKKIYTTEDFYREKIEKDAGKLGKVLVRKLDRKPSLSYMPSSYFTRQLWGVIKTTPKVSDAGTLAQPIEEINPIDMYDQHSKVTIFGEGGVGDVHSVTMEARNVHPSQFGFIDFIRTPESANVGIDQRLAYGVKKGDDNNLYQEFINARTGVKEMLTPLDVMGKTIAFPGEWESEKDVLDVVSKGVAKVANRKDVEYYLDKHARQYSTYTNLIPMVQDIQGNRMILAAKAIATSMPIVNGEAPLVRSKNEETGNAFEYDYGRKIMAKESRHDGTVKEVTPDNIFIEDSGGMVHRHGLYNNFPLNLKTRLHNMSVVKPGDEVKKGDLIATSNYTDPDGIMSSGVNLNSIYVPYKGWNFEDGIIISEKAAKKLTSDQMYTFEYSIENIENQVVNKEKFISTFPMIYTAEQLSKIGSDGVVKEGAVLKNGDPIILSMEKRTITSKDIQLGNLFKSMKNMFNDTSTQWAHHADGIVTDAYNSGSAIKVLVRSESKAQVGDKLTGRYGNKGVISMILPDEKMPYSKDTGEEVDIIMNPIGIPSRINPAQVHEAILGKIAAKIKKPYSIPNFKMGDMIDFVESEMKKHSVKPEETIVFPDEDITLPNVLTGKSYIWKLSKMSEGELKKRSQGSYDMEKQPVKGKTEFGQAMKIGSMEVNALLGHGAKNILKEISTIKGQENVEFWRELKTGRPIPINLQYPFVYNKFLTLLEGAGVDTRKTNEYVQLLPLTNEEIKRRSSGEIQKPELLYAKNMMPVEGGLFDRGITGGTEGNKWAHIKLTEPLPNPIMEEPLKKILGVNRKKFDEMIKKNEMFGSLEKIDIDEEIKKAETSMVSKKITERDDAIKKLRYLRPMKEFGVTPKDLMWESVPVIPPIFRPVSIVGNKNVIMPGGANLLYKDIMVTNEALASIKKELPDSELGNERMNNYTALKAVSGLADPINIQNKNKEVKGFLASIAGDQPKTGYFQNRVINKTQDLVARMVATPEPTLSMDEISMPRNAAMEMFKPFVQRRMIDGGMDSLQAKEESDKMSPTAMNFLMQEMYERPILMNRNPSLQPYNIMAFNAKLNSDDTIKVPPPVCKGFNLDHDGDQVNLFMPVTPEAVIEAKEKMMPSKNLFHLQHGNVHYLPPQGAVLGLYSITKNFGQTTKPIKEYVSIEDMKRDYKSGAIKATDLVSLIKK